MARSSKVHTIGEPVTIHARLTDAERAELRGVTVDYEVIRDGRRVHRTGSIGRIDTQFCWISGWCYFVDGELHNVRRV